jgi:hypothetical protein
MGKSGRRGVDGSFGRSAGAAAGRGALLLLVAVIIGVILLQTADEGDPTTDVRAGTDQPARTTTTAALPEETVPATVPLKPPAEVKVRIANGTQTKGLAKRYRDVLAPAGYNTLAAVDTSRKPVAASVVYFKPGFDREARVVAELLGFAATVVQPVPTPPPITDDPGDVLVVIGTDGAKGPPKPATTTTAAPTTAP